MGAINAAFGLFLLVVAGIVVVKIVEAAAGIILG
jgi:hypothetical protein